MNNYLNLPNIPSNLMGNVFLGCRGQGDCRSLTGKVLLTVIMVDDSESSWNVLAISDYKKKQAAATAKLQAEAKRYGVSLNIGMHYLRSRIEGTFSIQDFSGWVSKALRGAGLPQEEEVIPMLRRNAGVKEAAIIFAVNRPGRAFAIARNIQKAFEYTIVYGEDADYRHELLHLFGAKDFYYPADVKKIAEKYFSDSIMMRTYGDVKVDELTAYLVGWTDKVSDKIQRFLTETSWVTSNISTMPANQKQKQDSEPFSMERPFTPVILQQGFRMERENLYGQAEILTRASGKTVQFTAEVL